ncbi:MAG TPA: FAD-dependent oxidoreductase [Miltoncostaeaceae bacterium]|jgi:phytoene dehydrogenase-like protein|nr:FAD-dependent oxidoreductase [Miltoncostaeaceae bacterium]
MTIRPAGRGDGLDCVVVGGGLAGLACAHGLVRAGRTVHVLEAADAPGGRARTVWHRGRPVDRGFQVLLRAYPRARALVRAVGIPRRDLRPVSGGVVFLHGDGRLDRLGTSPVAPLRFTGLSRSDRGRLAALGAEVVARPADALLAQEERGVSTEEFLRRRGFSDDAIEEVFRPLFGVILLDRSLGADTGYFRFLMGMLARGPAVIPSDGLGMIAEWTSAAVRQGGGTVELNVRATGLEPGTAGLRVAAVATDDGRRLEARQVVLATEAPAAADLLAPLDPASAARLPSDAASSATAAFALRTPLYRGRAILLNADRDGGARRVDLICQTTNVTRPGAPEGPHILLATRVTTGGAGADGLVEATGDLVRRWAPGYDWAGRAEPIGVYEHRFAQFRPVSGVRRDLPGPRTALENLVLAGDLTTHPSIEGAVDSGARAAGIVDALLP